MKYLVVVLLGCASTMTPRAIARNLDACVSVYPEPRLGTACGCVEDAKKFCERYGYPANCAWDGWNDRDRDGFTVWSCIERMRSQ